MDVTDSLSEKEVEMIVYIIVKGKKYSWYEARKPDE